MMFIFHVLLIQIFRRRSSSDLVAVRKAQIKPFLTLRGGTVVDLECKYTSVPCLSL